MSTSVARRRLLALLTEEPAATSAGYVDLLGAAPQAGPSTGLAQRLMRTPIVPLVYERWWRPALGRLAKGPTGPSMAAERRIAGQQLRLEPTSVVLDVACGTGSFSRAFARALGPTGLVIGLDASVPMLEQAVAATPDDLPVAYLRGDAVRPALPDGSVDALCCFAALHMFDEPVIALESFLRVLRPGGRLVLLTTGARRGPAGRVDRAIIAASGQHAFDRGEVGRLLRERGADVTVEQFHGLAQIVGAVAPL